MKPFKTHHTNEQAYEEIMEYSHKEREGLLTLWKYKPHLLSRYAKEVLHKYSMFMQHRMMQMKVIATRKKAAPREE